MFIFVLMVSTTSWCKAQFGLNARYIKPNFSDVENENIVKFGIGGGIDYWFRLKTKRIEFMPEIGYENFETNIPGLKMNSFYFMFKTNFYLLNFNEDCNCPTFSKDGNTISKGFFISIAPEVKSFTTEFIEKESTIVGGVVLGAGIDFGITELLTITPNVGYEITSNINDASYSALQLGIRTGFRFNNGKKKFRR